MLYDPERRWLSRASCRTAVDPERFFVSGGNQLNRSPSAATQVAWNDAKKICSFCPVLTECRRDTLGEEYGVWGGLDEHERFLIRKRLAAKARWKKWPEARQLEWGEHLDSLRKGDLTWRQIQFRTGIPRTACEGLIAKWRQSRPAQPKAPARVVDLPLPPVTLKEFPEVPGQRHMWVRHRGLVSDGWYAGETEDGAWIRVQVWSGRGNVIKWVQPEDVRIYNPQRSFYLKYVGRKQREQRTAAASAA